MIALCWKEMRENFKWALLAMLGLGGAECFALYQSAYTVDYYFIDGITLCKKAFLTVTTFACPAIGLMLGLVQILPELRRDRWASLLHRPVSRGVIFRGKVVAGLLLYLLATVVPFLFSVWLVATPGHFGVPFLPGMIQPGVADICVGAVYYFAALALALQRGGWIGLRIFPLLAAVHASYFVSAVPFFNVAVEGAVLMSLALFTAGWGMILNQDSLGARPWLGRFAFLAGIFYGACGLGDLSKSFFDVVGIPSHSHNTQYELSDEGVPLKIIYKDNIVVSVTDLNGNPLQDKKYQPDQIRSHLNYLNRFSSYIGDSHGWKPWSMPPSYRASTSYIWALSPYFYPRLEQWFQLVQERSLIGFAPAKKIAIGRFDQEGFKPVSAEPQPFLPKTEFGQLGSDRFTIYDDRKVSFGSFPKREVAEIALPAPGPIYGVSQAWARTDSGSVSVIGVALTTGLAVYDDKATFITLLPYHQDVERWGQVQLGLNAAKDRFYLWYEPSAWIGSPQRDSMPSYVEEVDVKGQVLQSYTLPPVPPFSRPYTWSDYISDRLQSPGFFFGSMVYQKIGAMLGSERLAGDLSWRFGPDRLKTQKVSLWITVSSLILAGATLFWARRVYFSWRRAWAWTAFVFAFNLAGFITFRLAADWPCFVSCFQCGQQRPTHEKLCPHCGAGWAALEPEGTEIFDGELQGTIAEAQV